MMHDDEERKDESTSNILEDMIDNLEKKDESILKDMIYDVKKKDILGDMIYEVKKKDESTSHILEVIKDDAEKDDKTALDIIKDDHSHDKEKEIIDAIEEKRKRKQRDNDIFAVRNKHNYWGGRCPCCE